MARKVVLVTDKEFQLSEMRPILDLIARHIARELINEAAEAEKKSCQDKARSNQRWARSNRDNYEKK